MPKPYYPKNKKTLYGTQSQKSSALTCFEQEVEEMQAAKKKLEKEWESAPRYCAICSKDKPGEWYELMQEGWVCDPCRPKASHIKRESHGETHDHERRD